MQEDWEIKPLEEHKDLQQIMQNTVYQTIKRMNLSDNVNEETMTFLVHLAGVLDDEGIGISERRERDNRYKLVKRLRAKIATQELEDTVTIYLCYSLGINSLLLFVSYWPIEAANSVMKVFGKTSTELRAEREQTLHSILTRISELIEKELYREGANEL